MADPLFAASRMKLDASQFIAELESELDTYRASKPVTGRLNIATGHAEFEWIGIGLKSGAIIGDAIHNMRTALDLMASEHREWR